MKGSLFRKFRAYSVVTVGALYFLLPLVATFLFSLKGAKDVVGFTAYDHVFADPQFFQTFAFSLEMALMTIVGGLIILVPTTVWVHIRLPKFRVVMELLSVMPFVIPPIVLVFGLLKLYGSGPLTLTTSPLLLVAAYIVLVFPYMYRAIDTGLRAIDVKRLVEAGLSLGAGPFSLFFKIIVPNIRKALVSAVFLSLAIVLGELTIAVILAWPAFGPYMALVGRDLAYEPAALAIISFLLTWFAIMFINLLTRGNQPQDRRN